jgi:hypothetical protein
MRRPHCSIRELVGRVVVAGIAAAAMAATNRSAAAPQVEDVAAAAAEGISTGMPEDRAGSNPQDDLLRFAFEVASLIPREPHLKDRSRAQEAAVLAMLAAGRIDLATDLVERMDGWRRGTGFAEVAFALAGERPDDPRIRRYLVLASNLSDTAKDWRKDRIRMAIARVHARLGESAEAARIARSIAIEEVGKIDVVRARHGAEVLDDEAFAARQAELAAAVASGNFDLVRSALAAQVGFFERYQADDVRRLAVERAIREGWVKVPHSIRIDLLLDMSAIAAAAGDAQAAQRFAAEARSILDANRWIAESEVPMLGRIATAFANAGADEAARAAIERAEEVHGTRLQEIYDIYRAGALRPVAEAWVAVGDADRARAMYLRALASGMENPNARPRAIDLAATARSMAASGFQPDAELLEEMRAIRTRLGDPW